jgi:histidinol-phosphate/aromatic aminotransferase/cobyric acid decarboxylase-like protein
MHAALRWVVAHGGRRIVALGRTEVLRLYLAAGLSTMGRSVRSGAVTFELMHGEVDDLVERSLREHGSTLRRLEQRLRWTLEMPFLPGPEVCAHGGASIGVIGRRLDTLETRHEVVPADVLDAWFPPAPGVVEALREDPAWLARTSPPAAAEGLVEEIAVARGLPASSIAVGAGSSDLIFRAFRGWLRPSSKVLLLDPTYGEYAHVVEKVIGCRADRFPVRRQDGWRIDPDRLRDTLTGGYDLVVIVNPNNPTGRHLGLGDLRRVLDGAPERTRFWIDEAYLEYAGPGQTLEPYAVDSGNVVVSKSLSKMYALSGMRAAYLAGPAEIAAESRRWTPPWAVSLPAQIAAVHALRDPAYYAARWAETAALRADLAAALAALGGDLHVLESAANSVLLTLPPDGPGAARLVRISRQHDVFLRDLSPMSPAFEGRTVRIAVRDAAANARTTAAIAAALHGIPLAGKR